MRRVSCIRLPRTNGCTSPSATLISKIPIYQNVRKNRNLMGDIYRCVESGMPTSAAYIMSATLLCPSIIKLGVPTLAAHFFVFYFANLSMITPPVALSSFTAAGIVNDNMWKLGLSAFKYSFIIFIIPYTFVYSPDMLGIGNSMVLLQSSITCLISAYGLSMGLIGGGIAPMKRMERILAIAASLCLIIT